MTMSRKGRMIMCNTTYFRSLFSSSSRLRTADFAKDIYMYTTTLGSTIEICGLQ
jgi:hypothetical protein